MSRAAAALAFAAKRQATNSMSTSAWAHVFSLELRWLSPGDARRFVDDAVQAGLLVADGDGLRLGFDAKAVEVPRRFRLEPSDVGVPIEAPAPADQAADPFKALLEAIETATGEERGTVMERIAAKQQEMGGFLEAEAAALLLAAEAGIDVRDRAADALRRLTRA